MFAHLAGREALMGGVLYGSGLRLMEGLRLRVVALCLRTESYVDFEWLLWVGSGH